MPKLLAILLVTGCFHWVRVDDPAKVRDTRVRVIDGVGVARTIDHACAIRGDVIGGPGAQPSCACRDCVIVDVARERVYVKRFHGWKTATVALGTVVTLTVMMFAWAAAAAGVAGG
jgi:hypothetical protein